MKGSNGAGLAQVTRPQAGKAQMTYNKAVANDDYADFPAVAAALDAISSAGNAQELSAARDQLRKAELQRDIALGFTGLWGQWERDQSATMGLL